MPSSATFWTLMERWQVPDDQALELIAYEGKLPTTGKRPRFKLSSTQAEIVSSLVEIDIALTAAGMDADWLRKPMSDTDRAPLDLLRAGAMEEVLGSLRKLTFEASLRRKRRQRAASRGLKADVTPSAFPAIRHALGCRHGRRPNRYPDSAPV
jgi:hypothetical protein